MNPEIARRTRPPRRPSPWRRRLLVGYVTLYGASLGAAAILISLVARAKLEPPDYEPVHLPSVTAAYMAGAGLVAGAACTAALAHWLARRATTQQHPLIWVALGLGYAVIVPFLTGALTPVSLILINLTLGVVDAGEAFSKLMDSPFRAATAAFSYGTLSLGTTALAAVLLTVGSFLADLTHSLQNRFLSNWVPPVLILILSAIVTGFAAAGPPTAIAKLG